MTLTVYLYNIDNTSTIVWLNFTTDRLSVYNDGYFDLKQWKYLSNILLEEFGGLLISSTHSDHHPGSYIQFDSVEQYLAFVMRYS